MKLLLLNGHGINFRVDNAKLHITDGRFSTEEKPEKYIFSPKRIDIDSIIVYGQSGNISIEAIKWLVKHNVQLSVLGWNGKLMTTMLPPESVQVNTKFAQYKAYSNVRQKTELARKFIQAKFVRTQVVLDWLKLRYPELNNDFSKETKRLPKARTTSEIRMVEARVASFYWQELVKIIPDKYEFKTREYQKRPWGAGDIINCMFNYGYSILEGECLRAINTAGLDCHVGFMHEKRIGKNSLAYDLQEPYRFLIDLSIINLIERNAMEKKDFVRTESYNLRLRPTGARKLVNEINNLFNSKARFQGKSCTWSYIIQIQTRELAHLLLGKKRELDLTLPNYKIKRQDTEELRKKILAMPYLAWKKLGFSKGTLHYLKKNARANKPFTINKHVYERLLDI